MTVQTTAGNRQVRLKVQGKKLVVDSTGFENDVPLKDWMVVGLYEEGKESNKPLHFQMHCIGPVSRS